jgi:hypothetical protein
MKRETTRTYVRIEDTATRPMENALWAVDGRIYEILHVEPRVQYGGSEPMRLAGYDLYLASVRLGGPVTIG